MTPACPDPADDEAFDRLCQRYWETFGVVPPIYFGVDDAAMAELYRRALDRGTPLGDDDDPEVPEGADI
jgi:hypothetical protein